MCMGKEGKDLKDGSLGHCQFDTCAMRFRINVVTISVIIGKAACLMVNFAANGSASWLVSQRATRFPFGSTHCNGRGKLSPLLATIWAAGRHTSNRCGEMTRHLYSRMFCAQKYRDLCDKREVV